MCQRPTRTHELLDVEDQTHGGTRVAQPPRGAKFVQIVAGDGEGCGLVADGHVVCWDRNGGSYARNRLEGAVELAIGGAFVCGRMEDGKVRCEALTPSFEASRFRVPSAMEGCTKIVATGAGVCCQTANDDVLCERSESLVARPISGLPKVASLAASWGGVCALTRSFEVWCWDLDIGSAWQPERATTLPGAMQIDVAGGAGCARSANGLARCWMPLQQGLGAPSVPVALPLAGSTTCATSPLGGSLPNCDSTRCGTILRTTPTLLPDSPHEVVELALGQDHACLRQASGVVSCWGSNHRREVSASRKLVGAHLPSEPDPGPHGGGCSNRTDVGRQQSATDRPFAVVR
jgi:hypothetical protein